jgi:FG-GAP-like repeat
MRSLTGWLLLLACLPWHNAAASPAGLEISTRWREGRLLAHTHCTTCHLFPEPDAVDRQTWHDQILPRMKWRLGFTTPELDQSPNVRLLRAHKRVPLTPVITEDQWLEIAEYYFAEAPTNAVPGPRPEITFGVPGFTVVAPAFRHANPATTAVRIVPATHSMLVADDTDRVVRVLDAAGGLTDTLQLTNTVTSLRWEGSSLTAAAIGHFQPSDEHDGAVFELRCEAGKFNFVRTLLGGLVRTTDAWRGDLNGDGRADLLVSGFGNNLGGLSWYEALATGGHREHVLYNLPGSLKTEVADFNGDGRPDIAVLVAQETEGLFLFLNDGKGGFDRKTVFQHPPYYGHSYFELADFNHDGRPDFLVTNGDNGEYPSPSKRYHGVRIYASQPDGTWRQEFFFPMNGAYKAVARDFDGDGDLDIAAVSFFPDYAHSPRESFVYLENEGGWNFRASTVPQCLNGRWITLDAADLDGDGDDDIVLGSYIHGPYAVPPFLMAAWEKGNLPVMILRNDRPRPGAK